jgi:hypothetical protein
MQKTIKLLQKNKTKSKGKGKNKKSGFTAFFVFWLFCLFLLIPFKHLGVQVFN